MKMQLSSICRRLTAAVLLAMVFGASLSMAAVTLATAHADLAAGNFAALKTDTETLIASAPTNSQEAHVLHAIALLGLAAKNDASAFAVSLGAKAGATIDLLGNTTSVDFPTTMVYSARAAWAKSGATYAVANAFSWWNEATETEVADTKIPAISFENKGATAYDLVLQFSVNDSCSIEIEKDGNGWGYLYYDGYNNQFFAEIFFEGSFDEATNTLTIHLDAGEAVSLTDYENAARVDFTVKGTLPATVTVLNGKSIEDSHPKFANGANVTSFFTFAAKEDTNVLVPILSDLAAVTSTAFTMTLPAAETGHPQDIVIQYPDVQFIIGFIKFNQGMRLLSKSYNWSLDLSGGLLFELDGPGPLAAKNAALFSALTTASAKDRTDARTLLDAAVQYGINASDAGLWSRTPLADASYLFGNDPSGLDGPQQQAQFLENATLFRRLLTENVPVYEAIPGFAADASLPDTATFSLAPLFAATPVNIRGILPTFTNNGIQAGTSLKLLASGVLKGVDADSWENYLLLQDLTDPDAKVIETAPVFSIQPVGTTVLAGASQTFTAVASGYPTPTYQWKKNGVIIPGATGTSYTIDAVQAADAASYTVVATNRVANVAKSATSTAATLALGSAPVITTQPVAQNVKAGVAAKFTVVATGNPLPKYQWRRNGTPITGATLASYTVIGSALTAGSYDVVVKNIVGSVTSDAVVLTVGIPPAIPTQPAALQTVTAGQTATLTVVASGTDPKTYQWKKNGVVVDGATSASHEIANVQGTDAGSYTVTVTNAYGTVTSAIAKLAVTFAPVIKTQPVAQDVKVGATAKFAVVATGNPLPKYQWRRNGTPITRATSSSYSVAASALTAGSYDVVVSNSVGSVTSDAVVLTVGIPPAITIKPVAQTVIAGQPVSLAVVASGTAPKTYQWKRNGVAIPDATSDTYTIANAQSADAGSYIVTVTNGYGTVSSAAVTLTVKYAPVITTQPASQYVKAGATAKFTVVATANPLPMTYQWYKDDVKITGATAASYSVVASALKAGSYKVVVTNSEGTVTSVTAMLTILPP